MSDAAVVRLTSCGLRLAPCALLLAGAALAQTPQSPQAPPVFRGATTLVPIDVRVLDRFGVPITDLTQADFTVLEDRVPQPIRHFSMTTLSAAPAADRLALAGSSADLAAQNRRIFLIVLGRGRLQGIAKGADGMLHFVRERLLPQDLVAVLAWNRATSFTSDRATIVEVLERFKRTHEGIEEKLKLRFSGLSAAYGGSAIPASIQKDIDAVFGGPAEQRTRTLQPSAVPGARQMADDARRVTDELLKPPDSPMSPEEFESTNAALDDFLETQAQTLQDIRNIYLGVEYLRRIDGEKHLVFVSQGGLTLPRAENDRDLGRAASDARVAIDIVHTDGIMMPPNISIDMSNASSGRGTITLTEMQMADAGGMWRDSTAATLAELTGGRFYNRRFRDAAADMDRVDQSTRSGYLLGYYPPNPAMDGKYRSITVRVNRPGANVVYRHGYFARPPAGPFDREAMIIYSRIASAANYTGTIDDVRLTATATMAKTAAPALVTTLEITIDAGRLKFEGRDGKQVASIELAAFLLSSKDRLVGQIWKAYDLSYTAERLAQIQRDGVPMTFSIPVVAAPERVKLIVYDTAGDLLGSITAKVK